MPETLRAISELPSYQVERLNAGDEIDGFRQILAQLIAAPSLASAEALCIASQRILYALDELKWLAGAEDPAYKSRLQLATELLESVAAHRQATLAACAGDADKETAEVYFHNIGERYKTLGKRASA